MLDGVAEIVLAQLPVDKQTGLQKGSAAAGSEIIGQQCNLLVCPLNSLC